VKVPEYLSRLERGAARRVVGAVLAAALRPGSFRGLTGADGRPIGYRVIAHNVLALSVPLLLTVGTFAATWWYVVIYNAPEAATAAAPAPRVGAPAAPAAGAPSAATAPVAKAPPTEDRPQELGSAGESEETTETARKSEGPEEMTSLRDPSVTSEAGKIPAHFYGWFWGLAAAFGLLLFYYFWRMDGEQLEILKELCASVVPLGVLTAVVLAVILFGICTATESAAIGALGALYLAVMSKFMRPVLWWTLVGFVIGVVLGVYEGEEFASLLVAGSIGGTLFGTVVPGLWYLRTSPELRQNVKESTFLTAKTTAMVCWLFVGSALFSSVFALHGGQGLIERWVLSLNLSPLGFQFLAQMIIFLLGWPLEWTEIIVIFCPIFIPLLAHFNVDPILFGTMVAVNLQAAFLSPPVAMSAFYLKGVSPRHVTLNQIFAGMMPYMLIVCVCLAFMYIWPGMTLWLPEFLYGK
jgi:TRAP-type mannitol/chloroaromatic compound transport system permease large subunit